MGVGEGSTVTKKETEALSHAAKVSRMQRVYDMMREGEWKEVCNDPNPNFDQGFLHKVCEEFQGEDEYRETLLLWVRPSQVGSTLDVGGWTWTWIWM